MPNTTVFLLDIIGSNSLHGPVRELHQDNGISNQINLYYLETAHLEEDMEGAEWWLAYLSAQREKMLTKHQKKGTAMQERANK
jgi:hypothetical protein